MFLASEVDAYLTYQVHIRLKKEYASSNSIYSVQTPLITSLQRPFLSEFTQTFQKPATLCSDSDCGSKLLKA